MAKETTTDKGELTSSEAVRRMALVMKAEQKLRRAQRELDAATSRKEEAKSECAAATEKVQQALLVLRNAVNGIDGEQKSLPFSEQIPEDDGWRKAKIDVLQCPDHIKEKLIAADLNTMGDLADFGADERKHKGQGYCAIDGIGEVAEAKLMEAVTFFFAKYSKRNDKNDKTESNDDGK